jgi:epoxyqueuosine reductase
MLHELTADLGDLASRHGAAAFGVADVAPFGRELGVLRSQRASGRSARLGFTYEDPVLSTDVTRSFPWAARLVVVGWNYLSQSSNPPPTGVVVGRFATADHYDGLRRVTDALVAHLHRLGFRAEALIDDNRLVDRAAAVRSGIGWWGKSTMVLAPGHGPWMLLGSVVTDAPLVTSTPMQRGCGTCVACFPACPTEALGPGGLDARRCLATWLQTPGSIPQWIRPRLGRRVYGCDDCLTSCPPGHRALAAVGAGAEAIPFGRLLALSDAGLVDRFSWWFVPRRDGRYLRRNLLVAAGNSGEPETWAPLLAHLRHPSSMIRGHAAWALARGFGIKAEPVLQEAQVFETVADASDELALALLMIRRPRLHRALLTADEWAGTEEEVRGLAAIDVDPRGDRLELFAIHVGPAPPPAPILTEVDLVPMAANRATIDLPLVSIYDPDRRVEALRRDLRSRRGAARPV